MVGFVDNDEKKTTSLNIQLVGRGEDATRIEKRVGCAAKALGVPVQLERVAGEISECKLVLGGKVILDHLLSTVEIEKLLSHHIKTNI